MQIHGPIPSGALRFNFSSDTQRQALLSRLEKGQPLEARVLDRISEGRWAIRFMGHTLVAESRLSLLPGQLVQARVESLGPPLILTLLGGSGSETATIARALQDLGLLDDALNRAIVRGLVSFGRPVDLQNIQALRDLLLGLGGPLNLEDPEALEEMVRQALFLQSRGLPVTPDTLNAYLSHLPAGALGGLLESLGGLLKSFRLPGFDRAALQSLAGRIEEAVPQAGQLTGESLKTLLNSLGLDLEGRLAGWLAAGHPGLPEDLENTLKLALLRLQTRLENLDPSALDDAGRSALQNLQDRLNHTLRFLNTAQAEALPVSREALHLQLPLFFNEQAAAADLRLFYHKNKDGSRRLDPDNLSLSLSLDLTGLGPLRIDLAVADRRAVCNIHAADEQKTAFLQETAGELKTALETCGYTVSTIACRTLKNRDESEDGPPPSVGLDLRV